VAQDGELDVLRRGAGEQCQPAQEPTEDQVEQAEGHARDHAWLSSAAGHRLNLTSGTPQAARRRRGGTSRERPVRGGGAVAAAADAHAQFPDIAAAAATLDSDVVLDGELVIWRAGRLALALQDPAPLRTRPGPRPVELPAAHVVFDLLAVDRTDLSGLIGGRRQ
jgi:hypothetical protein